LFLQPDVNSILLPLDGYPHFDFWII
jgi:hypothetical protein